MSLIEWFTERQFESVSTVDTIETLQKDSVSTVYTIEAKDVQRRICTKFKKNH